VAEERADVGGDVADLMRTPAGLGQVTGEESLADAQRAHGSVGSGALRGLRRRLSRVLHPAEELRGSVLDLAEEPQLGLHITLEGCHLLGDVVELVGSADEIPAMVLKAVAEAVGPSTRPTNSGELGAEAGGHVTQRPGISPQPLDRAFQLLRIEHEPLPSATLRPAGGRT